MIKAVLIDDVKNSRITLADDLKTYCPDIHIVGEGDSVLNGIAVIKQLKPEIVFLDIELQNGTGFGVRQT